MIDENKLDTEAYEELNIQEVSEVPEFPDMM